MVVVVLVSEWDYDTETCSIIVSVPPHYQGCRIPFCIAALTVLPRRVESIIDDVKGSVVERIKPRFDGQGVSYADAQGMRSDRVGAYARPSVCRGREKRRFVVSLGDGNGTWEARQASLTHGDCYRHCLSDSLLGWVSDADVL